jgi:hypothetical protein
LTNPDTIAWGAKRMGMTDDRNAEANASDSFARALARLGSARLDSTRSRPELPRGF